MIQHHVQKLQEREKTEQKIPSNQTSEKKKTKNDGASGLSTSTDATSLDISDQGERNDAGEKPRVLIKKISERYKKF